MKVHWTATAEQQLDRIYTYLAEDSPVYARQIVNKLTRCSQRLSRFPLSGRQVPEYRDELLREVIEFPYRVIYRIKEDQIDVIAVIHGARNLLDSDP